MFDSNGESMFDDPNFFNTCVEKFPIGMKMEYVFYELPYWLNLKISLLLDPMPIYLKIFNLLYGVTYHLKKVTHWLLREISFLQKVKGNIGQEKKVMSRGL